MCHFTIHSPVAWGFADVDASQAETIAAELGAVSAHTAYQADTRYRAQLPTVTLFFDEQGREVCLFAWAFQSVSVFETPREWGRDLPPTRALRSAFADDNEQ